MSLQNQVTKIEHKLEDQNKILIELARYDGRLAVLEQRIEFALNISPARVVKLKAE